MISARSCIYAAAAVVTITIVSPVIALISIQCFRLQTVPHQLPWAGLKKKKFLPKLRACLREPAAGRDPVNEGYEKYGKHGLPFVLPALHWPEVALPPSNLRWLLNQADSVVSATKTFKDLLALEYVAHGPNEYAAFDFSVIRRDLTRQISKVLPDAYDEMKVSIEEELSNDMTDWKDVQLFKIIVDVSRRINNRVFVGLPLCRDKRFTSAVQNWEVTFALCGALIKYLVPYGLKPVFAPIIAIPVNFCRWRLEWFLLPEIRRRIDSQCQNGGSKGLELETPNDVLQWIIDQNKQKAGPQKMSARDIAGKTTLFNFFAVHTTALTASMALVDILCHSSAESLMEELRAEAAETIPKLDTDPRAVKEMVKLDSVIRESMRMNSLVGRGMQREVVQPGGITTPDGLHLPQGTHICVIISSPQRDMDRWDNPDDFLPLRFYKSAAERKGDPKKQWSAVHVTEDFLSFGLGKHACPGRFFAVQNLKLLLGYILANYELKPLTERPKCLEIGETVVFSETATVKARRRSVHGEFQN